MAKYRGTNGGDDYRGTTLGDRIFGNGGNDDLNGGGGNDRIFGGNGDDFITGGVGQDRLDGGDGFDAVSYEHAAAAVTVNLATGHARDGDGGSDRIANFEAVFGSAFGDRLIGGGGDEEFHGGKGDDRIDGGGGSDLLFGDAGNDRLNGGAGFDFVSYFYAGAPVVLDLAAGTATDNFGFTDQLVSIEGAYGSQLNDRLTGDTGDNLLVGNGGNDILSGGAGDDTLDGGDANDILIGGSGADTLFGGAANDSFVFDRTVSATLANADTIVDFTHGADTIDLSAIDANAGAIGDDAFTFLGTGAFTGHAGELRYDIVDGATILTGDVDGDKIADGFIVLIGEMPIVASDLFL